MLMELGIFKMLEHILGLYSIVAVAWVGALVADLAINKPLGLSPAGIEFKRAHLYDINPVGVGAMLAATVAGIVAFFGVLGTTLQSLSAFLALAVAFVMAPAIAYVTKSRFYIARAPRQNWSGQTIVRCAICEHPFETEDMAHCPAYSARSARCAARWKPAAAIAAAAGAHLDGDARLAPPPPAGLGQPAAQHRRRALSRRAAAVRRRDRVGAVAGLLPGPLDADAPKASNRPLTVFILTIIAGVAALLVLAQDSRRGRGGDAPQTDLLMNETRRTSAPTPSCRRRKRREAASKAKSRHVVGLSSRIAHAAQCHPRLCPLPERDPAHAQVDAVVVRRCRHCPVHDGLLDISKIEAGRFHLNRNEVNLSDFWTSSLTCSICRRRPRARIPMILETPAARGAHRREQAAADPHQPAVERDQVQDWATPGLRSISQPGRRVRHRGYRRRHPQERLSASSSRSNGLARRAKATPGPAWA
jgi:hypothetical protein